MKAWFVSDIHLKDINERNSIILLRFLHSILSGERQATHLFLVGDIFDLWVGDSDVFHRKFEALVDAIAVIKKKGVEVVYFEGNHDVHVKGFWQDKFGIPVWVEEKYFQLGPWNVRVEHGDLINPDDVTYLKYRDFIRKPELEKLAYVIPGKLLNEVGNLASRLSRKKSEVRRQRDESGLKEMIRRYAEKAFEQTAFDYIITGHMHIKDDYQFERKGRKIHSVNLGSWYQAPQVLVLEESGHRWEDI